MGKGRQFQRLRGGLYPGDLRLFGLERDYVYCRRSEGSGAKLTASALPSGSLIVIALYLAINAVYIYAVPVTEMKGAATFRKSRPRRCWLPDLGMDYRDHYHFHSWRAQRRDDDRTADLLRDGAGWRVFSVATYVHPKFGTPSRAIFLQAVWACLLILTNTWGTLFTYVSVVITLFSAFTVGSVIVLRYKRPDLKRPYRSGVIRSCRAFSYSFIYGSSGDR